MTCEFIMKLVAIFWVLFLLIAFDVHANDADELSCLSHNIYHEARDQSPVAQLAVAIKGLTHRSKSDDSLLQRYYTGTQASKGIAIAKALVLGGRL